MRFNNIRLTGGADEFIFWLEGAAVSEGKSILKAVDGLGPTEADVSIATTLNQGGVFQNRRPQNREIVMRIELTPNYGAGERASDIRETFYQLYSPLTPNKAITVHIYQDSTELMKTEGYIKKIETVPFNKDPEIQLTIACPQPYFQRPSTVIITDPDFDIAFPVLPNVGTAPVGFQLKLVLTDDIDYWGMHNLETDERLEVTPTGVAPMEQFKEDAEIWVDTRPGYRGVYYYSLADGLYNLIGQMSAESTWPLLHPGNNNFEIFAPGSSFTWTQFISQPEYVGV